MNNDAKTIESRAETLKQLLTGAYYVVPDFQREYSWGDDEVTRLAEDTFRSFSVNGASGSEYFLGSMVICKKSSGMFSVIDGQQRLATLTLLLCAIRDACQLHSAPPGDVREMLRSTLMNSEGEEEFHYRLDLQYEDSQELLTSIVEGTCNVETAVELTESSNNLLQAYRTLTGLIGSNFTSDVKRLKQYYSYLTQCVKVVVITTHDIAQALTVFETINDRGRSLDSMDLLKNLLFMNVAAEEYARLKTRWKNLVTILYKAKENPLRFLRYFVLASYDIKGGSYKEDLINEDEVYKWLRDNPDKCEYNSKPFQFVDALLEAASAYTRYLSMKYANQYLRNIRLLSGSIRQHCIMLLAARRLSAKTQLDLSRHLENLFFLIRISGTITREFEVKFVRWAKQLRSIKNREQFEVFVQEAFIPEKVSLGERFRAAFEQFDAGRMAQSQVKYVLGKFSQYLNVTGFGPQQGYDNLETFMKSKVELEHILPQVASEEALGEFGAGSDVTPYVQRLGNLTLIEKVYNALVNNKAYSEKRDIYLKSQFLLTQSIPEELKRGKNTKIDRLGKRLQSFEKWTPEAIADRQRMLTDLAHDIWEVPKT